MRLKEFLKDIDDSVSTVNSSDFDIEIIDTKFVPSYNDSGITFDNLDSKKKKCKRLESCVLYVDIRNSAKISASKRPKTLAKMYSSFVRAMIQCGRYYGGHIRNIIGDRVMVVFDQADCFENAVNTAILMNTVCKHILNKRIKGFDFEAGIGIDHGEMLITKSGAIKKGEEKEFYRSLVWLGKPANVASRLTDLANKSWEFKGDKVVSEMHTYNHLANPQWYDFSMEHFLTSRIESTYSQYLKHKDASFSSYIIKSGATYNGTHSPILMTRAVYDGFKAACPNDNAVKNNWFKEKLIYVKDYDGKTFGGDVIFSAVNDLS